MLMKALKIILFITLMTSCAVPKSQFFEIDEVSKTITTNEPKDNVFVKSNLWLVDSFVSAKSVLQYSDKEAGVIAGKFTIMDDPYRTDNTKGVEAVIKIFVKEGNVKVSIKPLPYPRYQSYGARNEAVKDIIIANVNLLINNFEQYLNTTNL
jgi:hypothetical protein